tara:strand:- start:3909 stop:4151 length:243 start_codon:yes stop_codon:yes gene_type:complete
MKGATKLIADHYYVKMYNGDVVETFQALEDLPYPRNIGWDVIVVIRADGNSGIIFGIRDALEENRIFEITEDEYKILNIK